MALEARSSVGKDTTGDYADGKHRETWVPIDLETHLHRHVLEEDIASDEPNADRLVRTLQNWVNHATDATVSETGDEDYRRVSTHELRRCWANHLLVEENVSPRIVMALGGWSSYDAIEPYLAALTEGNIINSMSDVNL